MRALIAPLILLSVAACALVTQAASRAADPKSAAYENVCQPCHGEKGGGAIGPPLVPMTKTEQEVLGIVREGRGQMPPLSPRDVTDAQVTEIVLYLTSLDKK